MEDAVQKEGEMANQMEEMNSTMNALDTKVEKIDNLIYLRGWRYYGHGIQDSTTGDVYKEHTTFAQCVEMCNLKRATDGTTWNGMVWKEKNGECDCLQNDKGHDTSHPNFIHFKAE